MASGYFLPSKVIHRGHAGDMNVIERKQIGELIVPITSDNNISTCINAVQAFRVLQGIFKYPIVSQRHQLSVKVILMNVDDCSSPAWTWFVESECFQGMFRECSRSQIAQVAEFTHCAVTCKCLDQCDFLYLKYNLPRQDQSSAQLCEITAYRNGKIWSISWPSVKWYCL